MPDPPRVVSAADFTDEVMYAAPAPVPTQGWRGAVYRGSGHVLNPGPSLPEQRRRELEHRLRTPIDGSRRVVVMSRKGGVGKTTITLALGSTFALLRGDRVIAVDANPDAGNLAHRVAPPHDRTVTDVLRDAQPDHDATPRCGATPRRASSRGSRCSPPTTTPASGWPWRATTTTG